MKALGNRAWLRGFAWGARGIIALGLLGLVVQHSYGPEFSEGVDQLTLDRILLLASWSLLLLLLAALRWKIFIVAAGGQSRMHDLLKYYLIGFFVNFFIPSFLSTDVVRGYYLSKQHDMELAVSATFLDRFVSIAVIALTGLAALPFSPSTATMRWGIGVLTGTVLSVALLAVLCNSNQSLIRGIFPAGASPQLASLLSSINLVARKKSLVGWGILLGLFYQVGMVLNVYISGWAIGWTPMNPIDLAVAVPLVLVCSTAPLTPGAWGVQEGAYVFFLSSCGASPGQALAIAAIIRGKHFFLAILGWACYTLNVCR